MTPYPHIIERLTSEIWAITADAYEALWAGLENHVEQKASRMAQGFIRNAPDDAQAFFGRSQQPKSVNIQTPSKGISVVNISGVIGKKLSAMESDCGGVSVDSIVDGVREAADTSDTVIMNWHSPGGAVTGVPEAYDELVKIGRKKTLLSYTDSRMCSGAQWLGSAASSVYAAGTADTGSIGVYQMALDRSVQLAQQGIKVDAIHAGKFKLMGAPFKPMSQEERAMLQARCDDIHGQFKTAVSRGRKGLDKGAMEGQVLSGHQAKAAGIVDGIYPSLNSLIKAVVDTKR